VHSAIGYAIKFGRKSLTLVHKGNIMKFTEGAFRDWGYQVAKDFYGAVEVDGGPWCKIPEGKPGAGLVIKDAIADITLQQVLTRPDEFDVIATPNLNGDYLSDQWRSGEGVGIGRAGINYVTGHAVFEATHGTRHREPGQGEPRLESSFGEMICATWMDRSRRPRREGDGWRRAKRVTYDFARLMEGAETRKHRNWGRNHQE
jgi:isocitrate dehydrogenase